MDSRSGFDKLAPIYRLMERLLAGDLLQQARTAHVESVRQAGSVLMLGEGTGRLLEHLYQKLPSARFLVLDQSQAMLDQAQQTLQARFPNPSRVDWLKRDIRTQGIPEGPYDLITTPFFLDCFTRDQLETLIPSIASHSTRDCDWLLTDFQIPVNGRFRQWRAKSIHRIMYVFFQIVTSIKADHLADPDSFLQSTGFKRWKREEFNLGLIRSDHWKRLTPT